MMPAESPPVRVLTAAEAAQHLDALASILVDAVAGGASVNFMAGCGMAQARQFWQGQLPGLETGERILLVAEQAGRLLGTVVLTLAQQPNAPHRAEIGKMLVLSTARRRGIGRLLLSAAEAHAQSIGRTLLMLDTEAASGGEHLYRACGWTKLGTVPDHAYTPGGALAPTAMFYKVLGPHCRPV